MSRYSDYDDYEGEPEQILAYGRWQRNARTALKGKRGRQALRDLREALMALPEHRLIEGAMCTVGGADKRAPEMTEQEYATLRAKQGGRLGTYDWADSQRDERAEQYKRLAQKIDREGEGLCAVAAYTWHQKVKGGMDPAEAFASLPLLFDHEDGDPLEETAHVGEVGGLTFTLAWELAYRNDETFRTMTPEERWTAFVAWIDGELAGDAGQSAV